MINTTITSPKETKEPLLMDEVSKKFLKQLYLRRSYSGNEEAIRSVIVDFLQENNIPYINYNGNILGFNHPGAPLFSAHLDMVNTERYKLAPNEVEVNEGYVFTIDNKTNLRLYRDKDKKFQTSLGADDKNGIWVILTMLQLGKEINFAFCHSEEIGGAGSTQIVEDKELAEFIEKCRYGIIIDRRNAHDIIGYENSYCMGLDDRLQAFSAEHGYKFKCARGSVSDADRFSKLVECVNISCGYYEPHLSSEYTNLNELWNTLQFCLLMVDEFQYHSVSPSRMQSFKKCSSPYTKTTVVTTSTASSKSEDTETRYSSYTRPYSGYASYSSLQKKTSETTKTPIKDGGKSTTIDDDLVSDYMLELMNDAIINGAAYSSKLKAFVVPLYSEADVPDADSILVWDDCSQCNEGVYLIQASIDEMHLSYYDRHRHKVFGFCTSCYQLADITKTVNHLM